MPLRFSVKTVRSKEERDRLRTLRSRLGGGLGPDGAGPAVLAELAEINRERWETGGFGQWPPLARDTVRRRRFARISGFFARGHHYAESAASDVTGEGPVLVWTGRLRAAMADPTGVGSRDAFVVMKPGELKLGPRLPYANLVGKQRDFTELKPEHERRLVDVFERYFANGAEEA